MAIWTGLDLSLYNSCTNISLLHRKNSVLINVLNVGHESEIRSYTLARINEKLSCYRYDWKQYRKKDMS